MLQRADPALVDPGVTAQLECLLDEVLLGRQEMVGAIDAVCAQASRIIGRLLERAGEGADPLLAAAVGGTERSRGPARARSTVAGRNVHARGQGDGAGSAEDSPTGGKPRSRRRQTMRRMEEPTSGREPPLGGHSGVAAEFDPAAGRAAPPAGETALRIPFGNKETALRLGARYRAGGWYALPGACLDAFRERGWL